MSLLMHRFADAGYTPHRFHYPSVRGTVADNAERLATFLNDNNLNSAHLVCHSLGGLVVRQYLAGNPEAAIKRVVMIGTPNKASRAASILKEWPGGHWLLGNSLENGLLGPLPDWDPEINLGVIAGDLRFGIGVLIPGIPKPNDGTVTVAETMLDGMQDHVVVHASHFGLLISSTAFEHCRHFIEHGCFLQG